MAPKGIKASNVLKSRSRAKAMEWVTQEHSRGTRDIAVEVRASKGKRTLAPRQITGGIENTEAILHENALPAMDVDETFWAEEPVTDQRKRVSSPAWPSS
jgi:hypothetical protein